MLASSILQTETPCKLFSVDVPPDKSSQGLTKAQIVQYLVEDYTALTEYITAGQQYCYYVYLNSTYNTDPNADCIGICERLLNQSRTVAAQARRIVSTPVQTHIHGYCMYVVKQLLHGEYQYIEVGRKSVAHWGDTKHNMYNKLLHLQLATHPVCGQQKNHA